MGTSMNIVTRTILIMLILGTLVFSGCITEQTPAQDDEESLEDTMVEDVLYEERKETSASLKDDDTKDAVSELPPRQPYIQQMNIWKYSITPLDATIYVGDSVQWFNNEAVLRNGSIVAVDEPYFLTSEEGLWEPVRLRYANKFIHTFNESGTYHYYMPGYSAMNGTITVYEYNESTKGLYTSSSLKRGLIKVVPGEQLDAVFVPRYLLNVSAGERVSGTIREAFPVNANRLVTVAGE